MTAHKAIRLSLPTLAALFLWWLGGWPFERGGLAVYLALNVMLITVAIYATYPERAP